MKRRNIVIADELDSEFRKIIGGMVGYQKGAFSEAISEAMKMWIKKYSHSNLSDNSKKRRRKR